MSAQIEELLSLSKADPKKLNAVVGGLESQLESIKRTGDPRPSSVGLSHQESNSNAILAPAQQPSHSQQVTVQYVPATTSNTFQPSNVVISQPRIVAGTRHPTNSQVPVTVIQGGMLPPNFQHQNLQQVNSPNQRLPTAVNTGNGNRPMLITSLPQGTIPSNAVFFSNNGQQLLFIPRAPSQQSSSSSASSVSRIAPSTKSVSPAVQPNTSPAITANDDLANRGRKFLADLVSIASKQDQFLGTTISRSIEDVRKGHKTASNFVSEVQNMFVVRTGGESQGQIDQQTLVSMVHAALVPTNRSATPVVPRQQQPQHLIQQQHPTQQHTQIRIAPGGQTHGQHQQPPSVALVSGINRIPVSSQHSSTQSVLAPNVITSTQSSIVSAKAVPNRPPSQPNILPQPRSTTSGAQIQRQRPMKMELQDPELTDVAAMGGVDLAEESRSILVSNSSSFPPTSTPAASASSGPPIAARSGASTISPPRVSREQPLLAPGSARAPSGSVVSRLQNIVAANDLSLPSATTASGANETASALVNLLALATQNYLKDLVEQMSVVCAHRLYNLKADSSRYEQIGDLRVQLRAIDKVEQKMIEQYSIGGLRSMASHATSEGPSGATEDTHGPPVIGPRISLATDPVGKGMDQESARQRDSNATALAAIGVGNRRRLFNKNAGNSSASTNKEASIASADNITDGQEGGAAGRGQAAQRARRATLADVLFVLQQHPRLSRHPNLIYKYTNLSGK